MGGEVVSDRDRKGMKVSEARPKKTKSEETAETDSDRNSEERSLSPLISFFVEEERCEVDD